MTQDYSIVGEDDAGEVQHLVHVHGTRATVARYAHDLLRRGMTVVYICGSDGSCVAVDREGHVERLTG
jgi:hypothetical protein